MKYYYTDPLKAAWMAREFGFKYQDKVTTTQNGKVIDVTYEDAYESPYWRTSNGDVCEAYIHPNCYEMLQPQVGDLISINNGETASLIIHFEMKEVIAANKDRFIAFVKIIQRNGKAFFMPEVENDPA